MYAVVYPLIESPKKMGPPAAADCGVGGALMYAGFMESGEYDGEKGGATLDTGLFMAEELAEPWSVRRGSVSKDSVRRHELRTIEYVLATCGSCVLV